MTLPVLMDLFLYLTHQHTRRNTLLTRHANDDDNAIDERRFAIWSGEMGLMFLCCDSMTSKNRILRLYCVHQCR